jgi:hypothetical protein
MSELLNSDSDLDLDRFEDDSLLYDFNQYE